MDRWRLPTRAGSRSSGSPPSTHTTSKPLGVYAGFDTLVINYRNQAGGLVNEVLTFADGLVVAGHGTYRTGDGSLGV